MHDASRTAHGLTYRAVEKAIDGVSFDDGAEMLCKVHAALMDGDADSSCGGVLRDYQLVRRQPMFGFRRLRYWDADDVSRALAQAFADERMKRYSLPFGVDEVRDFTRFILALWRIHPFCPGNARLLAAISALYARHLGADIDEDVLIDGFSYFRAALIRNNCAGLDVDVPCDEECLERYFMRLFRLTDEPLDEGNVFVEGMDSLDTRGIRTYRRCGSFVDRRLDGEALVIPTGPLDADRAGMMCVFNASGFLLWERLGQWREPADLADMLSFAYGANPDCAETDAEAFVEMLVENGLVVEGPIACNPQRMPKESPAAYEAPHVSVSRFYANSAEADYSFKAVGAASS